MHNDERPPAANQGGQNVQSCNHFNASEKSFSEAMGLELKSVRKNIRALGNLPDIVQQAFWLGDETGRNSRDWEVDQLQKALDEVMSERDALKAQLGPVFAWRKWLDTPQDVKQGYPFVDLMGGAR